jgi:DNA-binding NarL/FixJ family response regulator
MPIRVLLVDDNLLFRDGVAQILQADGRFEVVGTAARGAEGVAEAARLLPDLILIDLRMPEMSGVAAVRLIRAENPDVPIGVLSAIETVEDIEVALEAGASGYVVKDATPSALIEAADALARGNRSVVVMRDGRPLAASGEAGSPVLARLTPREREVLRALAGGESNDAIADRLRISPKTLRNHISNAYHKLQIYDRAQAVIIALREGLIEA